MIINISLCLICDYFKFIYLFIRYYFFYYKLFTHELTICESIRILIREMKQIKLSTIIIIIIIEILMTYI